MTKQEAAQHICARILAFLLDNDYIEDDIFAKDDLETLEDIAQDSIGEYWKERSKGNIMSYPKKETLRNQAAPCVRSDDCLQYLAGEQAGQ